MIEHQSGNQGIRPIATLAASCLFAGACLGAMALATAMKSKIEARDRLLQVANSKIDALSLALERQGETVASLAAAPQTPTQRTQGTQQNGTIPTAAPAAAAPPLTGRAANARNIAAIRASAASAATGSAAGSATGPAPSANARQLQTPASQPTRNTTTATAARAATAPPAIVTPRASAPQPPSTPLPIRAQNPRPSKTSVTPQEIARAKSNNAIEAISGPKVGVASISKDAVIMQSGAKVSIGETFTSGEKLLSIDSDTGQIITDQRTILLL